MAKAKARKNFTTRSAEVLLGKSERLEARAERMMESADRRTKAGKAAVAEAQRLLEKAIEYKRKGTEARQKEYNAALYKKIKDRMEQRRFELEVLGEQRGGAGNEELMDYIDEWEERLMVDLDGVVREVYAAFEAAYKKDQNLFDVWIYYSEGSMMKESKEILNAIFEEFTGKSYDTEEDEEEALKEDDTFEETFV